MLLLCRLLSKVGDLMTYIIKTTDGCTYRSNLVLVEELSKSELTEDEEFDINYAADVDIKITDWIIAYPENNISQQMFINPKHIVAIGKLVE